MNATEVLKKIMTTLSLVKEQVHFTYAKLADGTVVESPTFDVGEMVDVVTEDGKVPAPDGEHELALKDSEGRDVIIKVMTKDGVITERENVELEENEEEKKVEEMESIAGDDMGGDEDIDTEETAEPISEDTDMKSVIKKMSYRIEELEKKMQKMEEVGVPVKEDEITEGEEAEKVKAKPLPGDVAMKAAKSKEDELPKLDGAPIDENAQKQLGIKLGKNGKVVDSQSTFLSKLYK